MIPIVVKGRVYERAFNRLIRKLCFVDCIEALNELAECGRELEVSSCDINTMVTNSLDNYLKEEV